ncbi:hypothetical protein T484DRAFT_1786339 [Baffinella frigidus]|nr:hypothetical protein T484DRAFT_1786339 [Cryptophyta sp. CCMP2293]
MPGMRAVEGSALQRCSWRLAAILLAYLAATHSVTPSILCSSPQSRVLRGAFRLREASMGISPLLRLRGGMDDSNEGPSPPDSAGPLSNPISDSDSRAEEPDESDGEMQDEDASEKVEDEESGERTARNDSEESQDDSKDIPDPDDSSLEDSFRESDRCALRCRFLTLED